MTHITRRFTAGDVIDQRGELLTRLTESDTFRQVVSGTVARHGREVARVVPNVLAEHLRLAEAYRVSADMCALIMRSATLLDETDQITLSDLPSPCGFVRFDQPLVVRDVHGATMLIHAMTWGPIVTEPIGELGVMLSVWNDVDVEPDDYASETLALFSTRLRHTCGRWAFIGVEGVVDGMRVGPAERVYSPADVGLDDDVALQPATNVLRYVLALLELLNQTIVMTGSERPNPHARRRAKTRRQSQGDVIVISLRRTYHGTGETSASGDAERNWHHRWVVRGHWRWAKVGRGRREVRRVWVSGHVKGPDDKPLLVTRRVYDLKR